MLQVIQREFEKLQDLIEYINHVSICYGYLKDYEIIKGNDKYNLLLKFDVPEVRQILELAQFKKQENKNYRAIFDIEVGNKYRSIFLPCILFSDLTNGFKIQGSFEFKNINDLIRINYDKLTKYFTIELKKFNFQSNLWYTIEDQSIFVQSINYQVIYNHLVNLIFYRGYLIDKMSLKELEEYLQYFVKWLNEKGFIDSVK